jgi:uncharacterized protein (TIGR03083 family)
VEAVGAMDVDEVWRVIDAQRLELADLFEQLTPTEWETPSLCEGWRVRDVAAHLTLAQIGALPAVAALIRARGRFDRMVLDTAVAQAALPVERYPELLRRMVGSRRKAPGVSPREPLIDVLVHGQDIAVPLGRQRPMPPAAAAAAAERVWSMGWPFHARRRLAGLRLEATDADWAAGDGTPVSGPVAALLLLLTGRSARRDELTGPVPVSPGRR